jgi:hypothetical protein
MDFAHTCTAPSAWLRRVMLDAVDTIVSIAAAELAAVGAALTAARLWLQWRNAKTTHDQTTRTLRRPGPRPAPPSTSRTHSEQIESEIDTRRRQQLVRSAVGVIEPLRETLWNSYQRWYRTQHTELRLGLAVLAAAAITGVLALLL